MSEERFCEIVKQVNFDFVEVSGGSRIAGARHLVQRPGTDTYYYKEAVQQMRQQDLLKCNFIICTGGFENVGEA